MNFRENNRLVFRQMHQLQFLYVVFVLHLLPLKIQTTLFVLYVVDPDLFWMISFEL